MIIDLESPEEKDYSQFLSDYIQETIESQDKHSIAYIRALWDDESWESIVRKANTEGSTWYVWWMDGVRAYMLMDSKES